MTKYATYQAPTATGHGSCTHCGTACTTDTYRTETDVFCCAGCQTVYQLLQENGLGDFYAHSPDAGRSQAGRDVPDYGWLAEPAMQRALIEFQNDTQTRLSLSLPDIHCASCIWLLENLHRLHEGVLSATVNFVRREARITFDHERLSLPELADLLTRIGYPPHFSLEDVEGGPAKKTDRRLIYQIGLAGFAFGNIMLLSFPEYLGLEGTVEAGMHQIIRYANLALAIPVLFYSGSSFWQSALQHLRHGRLHLDVPITIGMLVLFGRSALDIMWNIGPGYLDSLAGLIFFLLIGKWFQQRTFDRLSFERDYKAYFPIAATVMDGSTARSISLNAVAIGDRLRVRTGELITADGILQNEEAAIDYSFVTGESEPAIRQRGDQLYAGGRQTGAAIELIVTKKPSQSYLRQLWNNDVFETDRPDTSRVLDLIGQHFTRTILLIALVTALFWLPKDIGTALHAFSSVLIIACPCALALVLPFTYGSVLRYLGRQSFYLRHLSVVEQLQQVDAVVFDKTGTLTDSANASMQSLGAPIPDGVAPYLLRLAKQSMHPRSRQLAAYLEAAHVSPSDTSLQDFEERIGSGLRARMEGRTFRIGKADFVDSSGQLALPPGAALYWSVDDEQGGGLQISQPLRAGVDSLLAMARKLGPTYLLSGDQDRERERFSRYFPEDHLFFSHSPQQKLAFIRSLQAQGHRVMMFGDGLNDAGALQAADVGVVITEDTGHFVPACDAILSADQLTQLPRLLRYAQRSRRILFIAFALAFLYNVVGLSYAVQGLLSPVVAAILMPLSSITIVAIGTLGSYLLYRATRLPEPATGTA